MQKRWWLVDVMVCFIIGASSPALFFWVTWGDLRLFSKRVEMENGGQMLSELQGDARHSFWD